MSIQLNFINQSNAVSGTEVVIFSKNVLTDADEPAIAWTVIKNCGQGDNHPFAYPMSSTIGACDSYGNFTPQINATAGQAFQVTKGESGTELSLEGASAGAGEIECQNNLAQGSIDVGIYKAGKLYATTSSLVPGQKAVFEFQPILWIGAASEVEEGKTINLAIMSTMNTELSLLGIASADIVMTGGGVGPNATAFVFVLENIVMA